MCRLCALLKYLAVKAQPPQVNNGHTQCRWRCQAGDGGDREQSRVISGIAPSKRAKELNTLAEGFAAETGGPSDNSDTMAPEDAFGDDIVYSAM
jgi:hypothetical protein